MKGKVMMTLALIMGIMTTYLFYQYTKDIQVTKAKQGNMVEVVVAKEAIGKNQRIDKDDLEIVSKPEGGLHASALQKTDGIQGQYATAAIAQGEPILSHRLQTKKEEELIVAKKVSQGKRALSLGVNMVQSVSNLIEPEDYVDVYVSIAKKENGETKVETDLIEQKARVLAIGRKLVESNSKEDYVEYSSITIEVEPHEVAKIVKASEEGNIHMALRSRLKEEVEPKEKEN
ncbi:Flp pilus assembly protein CpaB [Pontibacillus marinus]|uniref:SAF domain-containing protein n=1 Tax=Pontibacillus marinus BH030004 = DSM 16465 TaxID=1385511 RepID=A0A0A5FRI5_9BACI|nr:Flp pilus assembly protein CpaB [Pontibacillus marinus]KGX83391.1 hypothetical protein N783_03885 [Pontibacillus marinus BH030004 = DSM 16465]